MYDKRCRNKSFIRINNAKTIKNMKTKKYNYFYYGMSIPHSNFVKAVPENWKDEVIDGIYSWGGYKAVEID